MNIVYKEISDMEPEIYILKNELAEVHVSTLGATLTRMITKDREGKPVDVILGMERAEDYASEEYMAGGAYLGAAIGRYGNRIARGIFTLDGQSYRLAVNNGSNHLHGGVCGFDKKIWTVREQGDTLLALRYVSPDGEENYPGVLTADLCFEVIGRELHIRYEAYTDRKCHVNLTHHPYFNLNPAGDDIRGHVLKLYTDRYLRTEELIPDGTFVKMEGDRDFTRPRPLREVIERSGGLDDCFVFADTGKVERRAELFCPETGIKLYVCSDYPGLQVYTGRYLDVARAKGGKHYGAYAGIALEAQFWPDSPNHPDFPSTLLSPGEVYRKTTVYGFE